ncbi:MAG: molybdopterin-dependent oxidoreductase [Anaerolineae bacterium]|jgi:sulfite oxidase|nr:molybdopterin-dependent oxidoreductase [Anaerolineae bacterium]
MNHYHKRAEFIVHQQDPFNGGCPPTILRESLITPIDSFYVRTHGNVPEVSLNDFRLTIDGLIERSQAWSLDDLKARFPKREITATLQCAGNRRCEFQQAGEIPSDSVMWGYEGISTAVWGGVALADVLNAVGVRWNAAHVELISLDQIEKDDQTFSYGGSIPLHKALSAEVLLAYEMNGAPLTPIHGYPLRAVVPGYVAARSVKWLSVIRVGAAPSENFYQQRDYKLFGPQVSEDTVDWDQGEMLNEMFTDSVICVPSDGAQVPIGPLIVKGYAVPFGGSQIERVEVSADDGHTWRSATLIPNEHPWAWRFWEIPITIHAGEQILRARAYDTAGNLQPETVEQIWNFRGYMNNSVHRIRLIGV